MTVKKEIGNRTAEIMRHCIKHYEAKGFVIDKANAKLIADQSYKAAVKEYDDALLAELQA